MLKYRRLSGGLEHLRSDCNIEQSDGISVDNLLEQQVRAWYLNLLDTAPRHLLAPDNISTTVTASLISEGDAGGARITLPAMCRRVFDIQLKGWHRPVEVLPESEVSHVISRQLNQYTAATDSNPIAVFIPGEIRGISPQVIAWPTTATPQVLVLTAVLDQGKDSYSFDEAALATLPLGPLQL